MICLVFQGGFVDLCSNVKIWERVLNLGGPVYVDMVVTGNIFAVVDDELINLVVGGVDSGFSLLFLELFIHRSIEEVVNENKFNVRFVFQDTGPKVLSKEKIVHSLSEVNFG
jgi:hypothetical protein